MKARRESHRESRIVEMSAPYTSANTARLYVGNLSWEVTWQDLKDHMRTSGGRVIRCDVLQESSGRSKGCGIVEYSSAREAADAIDQLNDSELKGRKIFIREDREDKAPAASTGSFNKSESRSSGGGATTVTVENLPAGYTWQDLKDMMKAVGFVVRADVIHHDDSTTGTVEFRNAVDVTNAMKQFNHAMVGEQRIRVIPKGSRGANNNHSSTGAMGGDRKRVGAGNKKLYVGQLAWAVTWQSLKDHFKQAGNVLHADVATEDGSSRSKGYGFVEFATDEEAQHAIEMLNDSELEGRKIFVREDRESR